MKIGAKRKQVQTIKSTIMLVILLLSYISFTIYLLFNEFDDKHIKILRSLGTVMALIFMVFMLFVTLSSIIASFIGELKVNYTILLFALLLTFIISYWVIKVVKFLE